MRGILVTPLRFEGFPATVGSGVESLCACLDIAHRSVERARTSLDELAGLDLVIVEGVPACDDLIASLARRPHHARLVYWTEGRLAGLSTLAPADVLQQLDALAGADLVATVNERTNRYYALFARGPVAFWGLPYYEHETRQHALPLSHRDRDLVAVGGDAAEPLRGAHGSLGVARSLGLRALLPADDVEAAALTERGFDVLPMERATAFAAARSYAAAYTALNLDPRDTWGRFSLDCAAVGVPCVGSDRVQTQRVLFPDLTVEWRDVDGARERLERLLADEELHAAASAHASDVLAGFGFAATRRRVERSLRDELGLG